MKNVEQSLPVRTETQYRDAENAFLFLKWPSSLSLLWVLLSLVTGFVSAIAFGTMMPNTERPSLEACTHRGHNIHKRKTKKSPQTVLKWNPPVESIVLFFFL